MEENNNNTNEANVNLNGANVNLKTVNNICSLMYNNPALTIVLCILILLIGAGVLFYFYIVYVIKICYSYEKFKCFSEGR
jgi:hypothetical protein